MPTAADVEIERIASTSLKCVRKNLMTAPGRKPHRSENRNLGHRRPIVSASSDKAESPSMHFGRFAPSEFSAASCSELAKTCSWNDVCSWQDSALVRSQGAQFCPTTMTLGGRLNCQDSGQR
jgi:hypothetical protein